MAPREISPEVSVTRQPRAGIAINGQRLDALFLDADVFNNGYFSADTFRCRLRLDEADAQHGPAFWAGTERMEVEIFASLSAGTPPSTSLILGRVDDVDLDYANRVVHLSGRDYTADLIETWTTEKFQNRTASEIATEIAGRHGLKPVVTETSEKVGHYYQIEHARLADDTSEWTLLTYLAEHEGFNVFVRGRELHFEPPADRSGAPRWVLEYRPGNADNPIPEAPAPSFRLSRSLLLARDITVKVISWNAKQKKAFTVVRRTQRPNRTVGGRFGSGTPYVFRIPGLTQEQAIREAERRLQELTRHERVVDVLNLPGDPNLTVETMLALRGTGTSFDMDYHLDEIERRISFSGAFTMRLKARNVAPDSMAAL